MSHRLAPLVLLLSASCVSQRALDDAETAFQDYFGPDKLEPVDAGSRCDPGEAVLEGFVHPDYEGTDMSAKVALGDEVSNGKVTIGPGGRWVVDVTEDLVCGDAVGDCVVTAVVTITAEGDDATYEGVGRFEVTLTDDRVERYVDGDGDGYGVEGSATQSVCDDEQGFAANDDDCDDGAAAIHPGANDETCDGVDNNCDGREPYDMPLYVDADNDGYGEEGSASVVMGCGNTDFLSVTNDDCNEDDPSINPAALELCDGIDNDCDGGTDDEDPDDPDEGNSFFLDKDGDGYFNFEQQNRCDSPGVEGIDYVLTAPAPEDADCDDDDELLNRQDVDGDGYDTCANDCDDGNVYVSPGEVENLGNEVDDDCNGFLDCYIDEDDDEAGGNQIIEDALPAGDLCSAPYNNLALASGDCLDDPGTGVYASPHITDDDPADGYDNDCDGYEACYIDADNDGYGANTPDNIDLEAIVATDGTADTACSAYNNFFSHNEDDCADGNDLANPGAAEVAGNGVDENCNGSLACFEDTDNDGFLSDGYNPPTADNQLSCPVLPGGDCAPLDIDVFPGQGDEAGNVDVNCDGSLLCYLDEDEDDFTPNAVADVLVDVLGFGSCDAPGAQASSTASALADCEDTDAAINPGATEDLDAVDNNCDNIWRCTTDGDGDGSFGGPDDAPFGQDCTGSYSTVDEDCEPGDGDIFPGSVAGLCDGLDNDCEPGDEFVALDGDSVLGADETLQLTQALLDAGPLSTVELCNAWTYPGSFEVTEPITLEGNGSTLDGGNATPVVGTCTVSDSVLTVSGAGWGADELTLNEVVLTGGCKEGGPDEHGGGLDVVGGTVLLTDTTIEFNAAPSGGGIALRGSSTVTWLGGDLRRNDANNGGGAWVQSGSVLNLGDIDIANAVTVDSNDAALNGAGVHVGGQVVITHGLVESNDAVSNGGGAYVTGTLTADSTTFDGNSAEGDGGGAFVTGTLNADSTTFDGNMADGDGGGAYISGSLTGTSMVFDGNIALLDGGGLYVNGPVDLTTVTFQANTGNGVSAYIKSDQMTFTGVTNGDGFENVVCDGADILDVNTTNGNSTCTDLACF